MCAVGAEAVLGANLKSVYVDRFRLFVCPGDHLKQEQTHAVPPVELAGTDDELFVDDDNGTVEKVTVKGRDV